MSWVLLDCSWYQVGCQISEGIAGIIEGFFSWLADAVIGALRGLLVMSLSFWAFIDTPTPDSGGTYYDVGGAAPGASAAAERLLSYIQWGGLVIAVISLIGFAIHMSVRMTQGRGVEGITKLTILLGGAGLIGASSSIGVAIYNAIRTGGGGFASGRGPVGFVQGHLAWYSVIVLVVSLIAGSVKMLVEQETKHLLEMMKSVGVFALVATSSVTLTNLLIEATDGFSEWILKASIAGGSSFDAEAFANGIAPSPTLSASGPEVAIGAIGYLLLVIVVGTIGILASLIQLVLMMFRVAMLPVMLGLLPVPAAAYNTVTGKRIFEGLLKWLLAFILYKPIAAIIYALSVILLEQDGFMLTIAGIAAIIASVFALPAMLKLFDVVTPAVINATPGSVVGALAAPTGAVALNAGSKAMGALSGALGSAATASGSGVAGSMLGAASSGAGKASQALAAASQMGFGARRAAAAEGSDGDAGSASAGAGSATGASSNTTPTGENPSRGTGPGGAPPPSGGGNPTGGSRGPDSGNPSTGGTSVGGNPSPSSSATGVPTGSAPVPSGGSSLGVGSSGSVSGGSVAPMSVDSGGGSSFGSAGYSSTGDAGVDVVGAWVGDAGADIVGSASASRPSRPVGAPSGSGVQGSTVSSGGVVPPVTRTRRVR
jgi:hypothetical protein